jgi:DUF971 family protein
MIFFQRKSALKRVAIFWIREPRFGFTHVVLAKSLHTFARHALVLGLSRETDIMSDIWPTELRVSKDRHRLTVTFNDGSSFDLSAEMLRVLSPSAEVQGHGPGQGLTVPGKRNVSIISMTPTGNYAVRIGFDDFHDTVIFTWNYLRELGENGEALFAAYERDLAEKGMTRDKAEKPR